MQLQPNRLGDQVDIRRGEEVATTSRIAHFVAALLRLPIERIRLQAGLPLAAAALAPPKRDLQEEEQTHVMLLAPADQRASYAAPTQAGHQHAAYLEAHPPGEPAHLAAPGDPYATSGATGHPQQADEQSSAAGQVAEAQPMGALVGSEGSSSTSGSLQVRSDLPAVRALNVKCEKNHMTVNIVFDRPFYGMVFSKGHYNDQKCVHLAPNSGQTSVNFDIHLGKCGMSSSDASPAHQNQLQQQQTSQSSQLQQQQQQQQPNGVFIENTIIIQYDPLVQEIYDQARKLRCTWYDYYEKSVTFRPYNVDMLDAVTANFLGDNIQCWMQIQVGKGPWSSEVAGIVKIGQTMTMVLAIKDDENRFDMLVRNCVAHDGKHAPIQLVDEYGCVARPKIMSRFQKVRNFGPAATVVSYAHFQAFKFPDSMSVHFQCVIQVCRYECPEPVCNGAAGELGTGAAGSLATLSSGTPTNAQGQPPASDYAASGTEIMPAKEPLPAGFQAHGQASYAQSPGALAGNQSHQVHQLRLDDSQGRVQVRLDTSMMAAMRPSASSSAAGPLPPHAGAPRQQLAPGPLPPHLLHMAPPGEQPATAHLQRPAHSPLYRPAPSQVASQVANRRPPAGHHLAPLASAAPPAGAHQHQFSMPYPQQAAARRSSAASAASLLQFGHRMGDQGQSLEQQQSQQQQSQQQQPQHTLAAPYETEQHPLSLIAAPRGLASGSPTAELDEQLAGARLRLKRSPTNGTSAAPEVAAEKSQPASQLGSQSTGQPGGQKTRRQAPSASGPGASSTSVQTQRTIQVVSPDDVAFSLMEPLEEQWPSESAQSPTGSWTSRRRPLNSGSADAASSVCFSTGRFLWVALVTVGALASGIVAVGVVILRQKAQLEQKLSAVYDHTQLAGCAPQAQPGHQRDSQLLFRRQQEELQQRHNYLARLYSQFTPASYWR